MFTPAIRITGVRLAVMTLFLVSGIGYLSVYSPRASAQEPKAGKLKELLKERHATLKEIAAQTARAYQTRGVPIERLHEAEEAVLKAELDLCDSDKERIAVLEKLVALAKGQEEREMELVKAGSVPGTALLRAKANRLEAEIALERAKSK